MFYATIFTTIIFAILTPALTSTEQQESLLSNQNQGRTKRTFGSFGNLGTIGGAPSLGWRNPPLSGSQYSSYGGYYNPFGGTYNYGGYQPSYGGYQSSYGGYQPYGGGYYSSYANYYPWSRWLSY